LPIISLFSVYPFLLAHKANRQKSPGERGMFAFTIGMLMPVLSLQSSIVLSATGVPIDIMLATGLGVSAMLMIFGNFMTTLRPNTMVGVRTPGTLTNPDVWRRMQRVGGRTFMLIGLVLIPLTVLAPHYWAPALVGMVVCAGLGLACYSAYLGSRT
jgi:uncharacterized membrane protein